MLELWERETRALGEAWKKSLAMKFNSLYELVCPNIYLFSPIFM